MNAYQNTVLLSSTLIALLVHLIDYNSGLLCESLDVEYRSNVWNNYDFFICLLSSLKLHLLDQKHMKSF